MSTRPEAVAFDVIGTLFALEPMRERLEGVGVPGARLELWYAGLLRDGTALDAAGVYAPLKAVAASTLATLAAEAGSPPDMAEVEAAVRGMAELPAHPDVAPAFRVLRAAGVRVAALSNGGAEASEALFTKAGLSDLVERIVSTDEVGHWKPRAEVYLHAARKLGVAPDRLALVAAHPWDVHGAARAGLATGYVARGGAPFPALMGTPDASGATLVEVADALAALPSLPSRRA